MGRYLVTGGAGFIGAAMTRDLLDDGHDVVIVDNLSTGFEEAVPEGATLVVGDCQDPELWRELSDVRYEAIYHIAGQSSGEISFDDPVYDLQTNTQSTLLLLQLALEVGCPRFLYASSMSVYGEQGSEPVSEDAVLRPKSFYGVGKLASEHYMRLYANLGVDATAVRLFNVYGPGQNMDNLRQGMVSIFLTQALRDRHIHVKGAPDRFRDFVYIDDVVRAFRRLEEEAPSGYSVFNVATGVRTNVETLIDLIVEMLPFTPSVRYKGSTPGDQFGIVADIAKIQKEVGWKPDWSLEAGIRRMVQWARE